MNEVALQGTSRVNFGFFTFLEISSVSNAKSNYRSLEERYSKTDVIKHC